MKRYAIVVLTWERDNPEAYMPSNYRVTRIAPYGGSSPWRVAVIEGTDYAGWTLHDYVLPRLASGGMPGREVYENDPALRA